MKFRNEVKDKRAATAGWIIVGSILILVIILAIYYWPEIIGKANSINTGTISLKESLGAEGTAWGSLTVVLGYIFGGVPTGLKDIAGGVSAAIVILALWGIMFLMFGDIIKNFSSFSREVAWIIAFLLAVVGANFKMVTFICSFLTAIFLPLGVLSAYIGLFTAFVVFVIVELGITSLGPWIANRREMQNKARGRAYTDTIITGMRTLGQVGEEASRGSPRK